MAHSQFRPAWRFWLPLLLMMLSCSLNSFSQEQQKPTVAVLRLKSSQETPERRIIVKDLAKDLAAALRENKSVQVPDDAAVQEAIDKEGLRPAGLLNYGDCYDVGERLNASSVVVGAAKFDRQKLYVCLRVLSVAKKELVGVAEGEYPVNEAGTLMSVLAGRISAIVANPSSAPSARTDLSWSGEYLLSFGKHRIDLDPPMLLAMNADPPFEVSIKADMAVARGSHAVTNFEVFVDDKSLGSIYPQLTPPIPIKERTWKMGGKEYLFSLTLKDMRVFTERVEDEEAKFVTSALISLKATATK